MLIKVEAYFDGEYWCARGLGEDIFTQGRTLDELHRNLEEAVGAHFGDTAEPQGVRPTRTSLSPVSLNRS